MDILAHGLWTYAITRTLKADQLVLAGVVCHAAGFDLVAIGGRRYCNASVWVARLSHRFALRAALQRVAQFACLAGGDGGDFTLCPSLVLGHMGLGIAYSG